MNIKKTIAIGAIVVAMAASATPTVTDVIANQRYPWNGLVDITCRVSGIEGTTNGLYFSVAAVMPDSVGVRGISHAWMIRNGIRMTNSEVHTNGNYRLLWDAQADLGQVIYSNMVVRVDIKERQKVQLWEDGPYWAAVNIGAEEPWESGCYFWWGDTVGYKCEGNAWGATDGSSSIAFWYDSICQQTYNKSIATLQSEGWIVLKGDTYVLAPEHDVAQIHWGGYWRMPTYQELYDLCYNKCEWTWTSMNGVNGYVVRGRGDYASASIFLPAAGYGYGASLHSYGASGYYWSAAPYANNENSVSLDFDSDNRYTHKHGRRIGHPVRPVQGFSK